MKHEILCLRRGPNTRERNVILEVTGNILYDRTINSGGVRRALTQVKTKGC